MPRTDTFIEKDSSINEQIDRMRHSATRALMERDDVIIVASVSCIYGIGPLENYQAMTFRLHKGEKVDRTTLLRRLVEQQYKRNDNAFQRGTFRVRGDTVDLFPAHYEDKAWRIEMFGDEIESIIEFDPLTGEKTATLSDIIVYANSHYVTPRPTMQNAIEQIKTDLKQRLDEFNRAGRLLEAQRLEQRTIFDIEMMETTGACAGIENYSRYLTGRKPGEPPPTLFEYFPETSLLIVDESHVTVPQIGGMFRGDFNRKSVLAEFGFRLPSAIDNRPLKFEEWEALRPQTTFVSATPGPWEMERTQGIFIEQVIRPTGLIDPTVIIRPVEKQVDDLIAECKDCAKKGERVLVTVLTKRMAEDLVEYMHEAGIRCRYLHSDIDTLERIEIIRDLRLGAFDVLVGINLLARGPRHPRMRAGGDPRRRQGGLPALADLAGADHRPRRAQRRRPGHPLCRQDDRFDQVRDRRDRPAPRQAARLQRGARHHAGLDQEEHQRDPAVDRRARPLHGRHRRVGRRPPGRAQSAQPHRRAREAHAQRRRQPRIRGGRRASATRSGASRPTSSNCPARPPAPMSASISAACRTAACSAACAPARAAGRRDAAGARATLSEASLGISAISASDMPIREAAEACAPARTAGRRGADGARPTLSQASPGISAIPASDFANPRRCRGVRTGAGERLTQCSGRQGTPFGSLPGNFRNSRKRLRQFERRPRRAHRRGRLAMRRYSGRQGAPFQASRNFRNFRKRYVQFAQAAEAAGSDAAKRSDAGPSARALLVRAVSCPWMAPSLLRQQVGGQLDRTASDKLVFRRAHCASARACL